MYYSMNGGSVGEAVLIDSQNPSAGKYDPLTHKPVLGEDVATAPKWWEQLFTTTNKAIDAFNPNLQTTTVQPVSTTPTWVKPVVVIGILGLVGYGIYRFVKKSK